MQTRNSTAKTYYSVWKQFNKFLIKLDVMPDSWEDRTSLFITYLIEFKQLQSSSIKSYISAIKRTLIDGIDYEWCDNQVLFNSLTRACRLINDKVTTRLPIDCVLLEFLLFEIERIFPTQPYLKTMYQTMFALGYYGLMRIGELTWSPHVMKACNVYTASNKEKILIILYTSKTHGQESYPQQIKITSNAEERTGKYKQRHFRLFKLMQRFRVMRGETYESPTEPFFIFRDGTPVTAAHARAVLKTAITALDLDCSLYNTHSLRIGRSCDLIKYGYHIEEVKRMGRWRSSCIYKYICPSVTK